MKKLSEVIEEDKTLFGLVPAKTPAKRKRSTSPKTSTSKAPRNYDAEIDTATGSLFGKAINYGIQRKTGEHPELTQIATALILCGLPYRKTDAFEFSRSSRAADGSIIRVTFYSVGKDAEGNRVPLAYGSDRTPLHWCVDKAIKTKSPFVQLDSASEFLFDLGQTDSGENYRRMREAFNRIMSLSITIERFREGDQNRTILPIIQHSHLPASLQPGATSIAGPLGVHFGKAFFDEFTKNHAPFPSAFLRDLSRKPQMQDYIVFLNWRSFAAKTTSVIPWKMLREQLWQDDTNPRRIKVRFADAIKLLKVAWPELNAKVGPRGLEIGPPAGGHHLFAAHNKETKYS